MAHSGAFMSVPGVCGRQERVCAAAATGGEPEGVATLAMAVETLKVAEHLTPLLQKQLLAPAEAAAEGPVESAAE